MDLLQKVCSKKSIVLLGSAACAATFYVLWRPRKARVCEIIVYPVKSCAEVNLVEETVLDTGFARDRIFQVTNAEGKFLTPRDATRQNLGPRQLFKVRCELSLDETLTLHKEGLKPLLINLHDPTTVVVAKVLGAPRPNDNKESLKDFGNVVSEWLHKALGVEGCRLHGIGPEYKRMVIVNPKQADPTIGSRHPVNLADEAPFLLTNRASLHDLRRRLFWKGHLSSSFRVDMRRYRPNIIIDGILPWEEDTWKRIRIGTIEFHVWQRCSRCIMTGIDRDSLELDNALEFLRGFRARPAANAANETCANFGMHLIPLSGTPANISVGDAVEVIERDAAREEEWVRNFGPAWQLKTTFVLGLPSRL